MSGGLESSDVVIGAVWLAAILIPLVLAFYGFTKKPKDNRLVAIGFLMAGIIAIAWSLNTLQEAKRDREVRELQKEIEASQAEGEPRSFQPEVRQRIVEQLRAIHGPSVFVLANSPDEETSQFAREIGALFKEAGWAVPASFGIMSTSIILPGENEVATGVILGATPEVPPDISQAVFAALSESGIEIRLGPHWPGTEHLISVLVGPKRQN